MVAAKRKKGSATEIDAAGVRELAKECLETKGKLNNIVTLLELCESETEEIAYASFVSIGHVYATLLERGDFKKRRAARDVEEQDDVSTTVAKWLRENRSVYVQLAFSYLSHPEPAMQVAALESLMSVVKDESYQLKEFHNALYQQVVEKCVANDNMSEHLLENLTETINTYDDVRYYFYKDFGKILGSTLDNRNGIDSKMKTTSKRRKRSFATDKLPAVITTGFNILSRIRDPVEESELGTYLYESDSSREKKPVVASAKEHKRVFSECWLAFLRQSMSADMHKRVLLAMHKKIIPFLSKPTLLIDFLVDSYDHGGAVSILALNGLFTLVTEHNLDYPDFYTKLYALFDKNLLHVKYRSRFLRLVDLFLSSSQLPSYLVAAFIKKMLRLALNAPPAAIVTIIPFVYNLLKRHPACLCLIHREQSPEQVGKEAEDPYLVDEPNPALCKALESSLWELQTLKSHYLHTISGLVRVFEEPIAKQPSYDLEDFLDHSYATLFESEVKKKTVAASPALATHTEIVGIFEPVGRQISDFACFEL
ncbi:ribosome biosynthesis protein NOC4 [Spizellomyces punctatus DAOM BR117]|uniref:CCAAT-binding factor domain-containing protein n=1 Tax=Spizellomyces punctatus (strain DAOM BR117) TaxID=645134 RepID=A0A0L0HKC8_SPIPD|nr:ribosome biosynthesis protein NOC4 [Spizellomyces punctatus DAOM BR117]KND01350.1 hypothetical protein SPPG_03162 [Spizellomyces punctatus DAOM BR117]|eukprot:XP_016609389.1 hypothetical protein SPPG_03162 [Spizellomyces punctatus DAOM BR117]